ncbi:AGE family epimerase/isomerase [Cellvibrio fibrivorans]|uniref:Cellobiose 2-epimerase n=1 Tax=Cellvibrio fibrivorans TaxID=126350 RepID=A0ABU1V4A1_9GAMM|nr:AGE family epimerase/isomerase [Cellvibrio fibrivorans]MDR7092113.1 mannobiose 2-epimerase [Cellvibrio fibrivorans]
MQVASLPTRFTSLQQEFRQELIAIADWWAAHTVDYEQGGFYGEIDAENQPVKNASKGIILNARILWFFSEVAQEVDNPAYRSCATRAYNYVIAHFFDNEQGGVYWELDAAAVPINTKKQVYAQAFTIYALCAYYQLTRDEQALERALECFKLVEQYAIDHTHQGYLEAFTREWDVLEDLRLSDKDLNFPKSQNTHLHILEAYTTLYQAKPSTEIKAALKYNILMFDKYIIDRNTHHLRMFMDLEWKDFSPGYTYGHDIEASWLIAKALESSGDDAYRDALTPTLIKIAQVTMDEAIGEQGQVIDSYDFATCKINPDTVWWVQAEALVGFVYAYTTCGEERFYRAAENVWQFIKTYQIDHKQGEWHWLSNLDEPDMDAYYKVGFWKCPYHNGRAMMEAIRYLNKLV